MLSLYYSEEVKRHWGMMDIFLGSTVETVWNFEEFTFCFSLNFFWFIQYLTAMKSVIIYKKMNTNVMITNFSINKKTICFTNIQWKHCLDFCLTINHYIYFIFFNYYILFTVIIKWWTLSTLLELYINIIKFTAEVSDKHELKIIGQNSKF